MSSVKENALIREVTKLQQEMKSLKTKQRYLTGQAKGYASNTLTVTSVSESIAAYSVYFRVLFVELKFMADHANKTVIPTLKYQFYDSSGNPLNPGTTISTDQLMIFGSGWRMGDSAAETRFLICSFVQSSSGSDPDAYYAKFWCVANDSGILTLNTRYTFL